MPKLATFVLFFFVGSFAFFDLQTVASSSNNRITVEVKFTRPAVGEGTVAAVINNTSSAKISVPNSMVKLFVMPILRHGSYGILTNESCLAIPDSLGPVVVIAAGSKPPVTPEPTELPTEKAAPQNVDVLPHTSESVGISRVLDPYCDSIRKPIRFKVYASVDYFDSGSREHQVVSPVIQVDTP